MDYQHWRINIDADDIVWLAFDKSQSAVNTIDIPVMQELNDILEELEKNPHKGLVLFSAKSTGFIAGADIHQFTTLKNEEEARALIENGQYILDKIEALTMPTVALIEGFCLGGGLEMALAFRYRIAEDSQQTRLGLPEVKLGIVPGWGGSVRLPRLIGAIQAMGLILTGRMVSGSQAKYMGFVDAAVPKRQLNNAARYYILNQPKLCRASFLRRLSHFPMVRIFLAMIFKKQLKAKIKKEHYPAPFAVLKNWKKSGVSQRAFEGEVDAICCLFFTDTCKNLIRVFRLQERLKNLGKEVSFPVEHIHVVGAGTMGADIAAWCALQGYRVTLQDRESKYIASAIKRVSGLIEKKLKKPHLIQVVMDRLMPDPEGMGVKKADVIIEAIFEDVKIKQILFQTLETQAKPTAILATNTSTIPLDDINSVMEQPERLVGIHFFNPVFEMQLIEIVKGVKTSEKIASLAMRFVQGIGRLPLSVKSSPGFLINRILFPYLMESILLIEEGISVTTIDKAMLDFGMPMGPVELADTVGLDICYHVAKNMCAHLGGEVPARLKYMVDAGKLGRKTNEGFYRYKKGKPVHATWHRKNEYLMIQERLVRKITEESEKCLKEGVVAEADLLDAGMIFGTGFAPFRGGPMHYKNKKAEVS